MPAAVAVVNVERICSVNRLQAAARHNLREIVAEICAHGRIDAERTHLNRILAGPETAQGVMGLHRQLLDAAQPTPFRKDGSRAKMRHDAVLALELVISVPPGAVDEAAFFDDALAWIDQRFGVPILSAVWHRDQGQEHVHCLLLPLKDGRMVGSGLAGRYDKMHDDFHRKVGQKHGLVRKLRLDARSCKAGASMVMGALDANPALLQDPAVRAALLASIERDPGQLLQAVGLVQERPPEKQWVKAMTRPVTDSMPIGFDGHGPEVELAGPQADDRNLSCVRVRHDQPAVDAAQVLAGEAWLVLPPCQLAATGYSDPVQSSAQPVRIVLDATDQFADDDDVSDNRELVDDDFIRVYDDQVPVEHWDTDLNQPMAPPTKPPSRRTQTDAAVQRALMNLTGQGRHRALRYRRHR